VWVAANNKNEERHKRRQLQIGFYLRLRFMLDGLLAKAKAHFTNIANTNRIYDALAVPVMRQLHITLLN
jgi:hypothetical protein